MSIWALFLIAAQAAPAPTANDQVGFDVQCMIASQTASTRVESSVKGAVELAMMFYFGRVDSALSGDALEDRLETEAKRLEGKPLGPLLQQCGHFMEARGKTLEAIGAKLEAREKALKIQ